MRWIAPVRQALRLHPDSHCAAVTLVEAEVARPRAGTLLLSYIVTGKIGDLCVPPPAAAARADELWRHTCFEAFVRRPGEAGYAEFNLSPSGEWAAYRFDAYRSGMRELKVAQAPTAEVRRGDGRLDVTVRIAPVPEPWNRADVLRIAVGAVVEDAEGALAYWALAHPAGAPDFHRPTGFVMELGTRCDGQ